ncbi:hypothetical protein U2106_15000, partial [Listeria monocytogenes]|uniref:hypothetical protein n=1 Tax=Listeria monocytogenes TaxID=1639 RepID=UPI002FDC41F4
AACIAEQIADPIFGHLDQKFIRAFKQVAEEMSFDVALTTPKLLNAIDMNRFDRKMSMRKAIRTALTTFKRFPEWFSA